MLKAGDRIRLFGGYDMIPRWLCGKDEYFGTMTRFIPAQNQERLAVIKLDSPITVEGITGDIVILSLRYEGAKWKDQETVHIELCDFDPEPRTWEYRKHGKWVESHAQYEILRSLRSSSWVETAECTEIPILLQNTFGFLVDEFGFSPRLQHISGLLSISSDIGDIG
jgi:hypothetical protein